MIEKQPDDEREFVEMLRRAVGDEKRGPVPPEVVDRLLAAADAGESMKVHELDEDGVETTTGMIVSTRYLLTGEHDDDEE